MSAVMRSTDCTAGLARFASISLLPLAVQLAIELLEAQAHAEPLLVFDEELAALRDRGIVEGLADVEPGRTHERLAHAGLRLSRGSSRT